MTAAGSRKLTEFLEAYPPHVRQIASQVLAAELGKLHLQLPRHIKEQIKEIIERTAIDIEGREAKQNEA